MIPFIARRGVTRIVALMLANVLASASPSVASTVFTLLLSTSPVTDTGGLMREAQISVPRPTTGRPFRVAPTQDPQEQREIRRTLRIL
jgi:hypothetical protein